MICAVLELRHLRVLREVARTGSFTGAARSLGYTQPAVSQQIRALERAAGTTLVARAGRSIRLTEAGAVLSMHAAGILTSLGRAEDEVAAIAGLHAGRVRLSAFPSGSATLVPTAIAHATAAHPGLTVTLTEEEPPVSVQSLRAGEADIALTFSYAGSADGEDPDLDSTELLVDPLLAVLPVGHALADEPSVPIEALAGEPWIAGCPRCRSNLIDVCSQRGFEPGIAYATDDNVAAQSLVAAGLGVALMPQLVLAAVRHEGIVSRPLTVEVRRTIVAKTWPDMRRVPAVAAVLAALVGAVG
jgi:DNA-binding transcriptional LysR family regulator